MDGICGMQQVSAFPLPDCGNILLIRPMLQFTRKQIEGYALSHGIRYRNDSTNSLSEYKRNRIRNEIFPQFGRINPSFVQTINKDITYFNDASEIVQLWCQDAASKVITPCGDVLSLDVLIRIQFIPSFLYRKSSDVGQDHSRQKFLFLHSHSSDRTRCTRNQAERYGNLF